MFLTMRTTLNLDDDAFELAKNYAKDRSITLGKALSELVRRGLAAPTRTRILNGIVVFDVPQGERITCEKVKELLEDWP